ncbi:MAG TPA: ABC transporter ATP-binding protein/permease [Candidatus Eisenbergiella merdipullorum]|uniref:ABC transporter ATP-binding protein/permease n=1 Tax=Candidatus Eisenbergiella merdipullorum TaxID=2838553 RepID=A0A9D2L0M2_9FIRM|nr:ABC transporter ATP-binding protein/permease [Candidatus Eisenbergiella merdipullorum]
MEKKNRTGTFRETAARNIRSIRIWWKLCPGTILSLLFTSVFTALSPYVTIWLSARIIDELAGPRRPETLFTLVLAELLSAAVLALISGMLKRWKNVEFDFSNWAEEKIYMDKMLDTDFADMDSQHTFDLLSRVHQNQNWTGWGLNKSLILLEQLLTALLRILGGVGLSASLFLLPVSQASRIAWLDHPLCVAAIFALLLLTALLSPMCANRSNSYWNRSAPDSLLLNRIFAFYARLCADRKRAADLRIYEQQENVGNRYLTDSDFFSPKASLPRWAKGPMGLWMALSQGISAMLTGMIYLYVCLKAWAGAFGVGAVTQYIGAITSLFLGISSLLETLGTMRANSSFLETTFEFLDIPNRMYQGSLTTEKRSDRQYEIEFRDVSFRYPGSEVYALRHVNLSFSVGSRLAVVGMNGSGKTTFIKLLCRLYDPEEGEILLNGIDIRKYRYDDYIRLFSVVFQDFRLMALPLGENVSGSAVYDPAKVMECLRKSGFEERLSIMPEGLDTYLYKDLDQDGVDISGGEAQKIAIARALYKDAPFIILDEPTASLDPIAEAEIYARFNDISGDRTAVYISHRLSSCRFCDEIVVFHEGSIIQKGSHEALLSDKSGKYHELWNAQAQYYTKQGHTDKNGCAQGTSL